MLTSTLALITPDFLLTVVIASSSGALTPGPLFLASTLRATRAGWFAGVECAVGHSMMELPLVLGLSIGLSSFLLGSIRIIGALGGATLIAFAILQLAQARTKIDMNVQPPSKWDKRSGVLVGLVFTAINPFFIIWWATVGSLLVAQALRLGASIGVLAMFGATFGWIMRGLGEQLASPAGESSSSENGTESFCSHSVWECSTLEPSSI